MTKEELMQRAIELSADSVRKKASAAAADRSELSLHAMAKSSPREAMA